MYKGLVQLMKKHSLAIITARGGSKRIPGKNKKAFCGKPILLYSIDAAIRSGLFDEVMVSTDDEEIAQLAIKAGAQVPFMRSAETANDYASTDDVIREVLDNYKNRGQQFDTFCCIYPTAPFITPERLKEAMALLKEADSVMPVVAFSYPVQRAVVIEDGELKRKWPEYANSRSQDLEPFYHDVGQFYACRTEAFYREGTTDTVHMKPMILNDAEVQDIDTFEDWAIAEMKYKLLHPQE